MDRRGFITSTVASAAAFSTTAPAARATGMTKPLPAAVGTLCNRPRATEIMRRAGLDAVLVTSPLNVYYATNAIPVLSRFTTINTTVAVVPRDPSVPIAYIAGGFEFYAGASDSGLAEGVVPYLAGGGFGSPDPHSSPAFPYAGSYALDTREQRRRVALEKAAPLHESIADAAAKALADMHLQHGIIGVDTSSGELLLKQIAPRATGRDAGDLLLHIRLVKTPTELVLIRQAATNNVEAAIVAAKSAREEGNIRAVRQRFYREASDRGNVGVYGSIDLVMSELADGTFREGQAFMVDFVSHYAFYQGDYGRTISFGEPDSLMRRAANVGIAAWAEIREHLRAGLKFSEIHAIGNSTVKRMGENFIYAFNPHSVGLQHWDQPIKSIDGTPIDLPLEAGMILSVDCPLLNAGVNGTSHVEDLVLIKEGGYEIIHRETDGWMQV